MYAIKTRRAWISGAALAAAIGLTGCATSQDELLPTKPGVTMEGIWRDATAGGPGAGSSDQSRLAEARARLRRPLQPAPNPAAVRAGYTRNATNEIQSQFARLPNPDLTLYIFPHLSGGSGEQVPVPGYSTVFPMYDRPYYAQPGEYTASGTP